MYNNKCELCNLIKITHWYFDEDDFAVMDCKRCKVPMYVWKDHEFPTVDDINMLISHANKHFPNGTLDFKRRSIPSHFHFHVRGIQKNINNRKEN